ncbi:predicted protein [Aspergillus terreus NIH2624]|uniref:Uncharacterized protein n=1 Tax=Aspergillus terreus (strain NIH 2624 / FGSC A1156) TaxID=341663 RepID=Q0CQ31_ASPTN|nr:uncharacterized protein ATEG_04203 [Aspergillus terreus NIH2624]EAU36005.1 predicted protein [Aspergillus terreus NIH2624]
MRFFSCLPFHQSTSVAIEKVENPSADISPEKLWKKDNVTRVGLCAPDIDGGENPDQLCTEDKPVGGRLLFDDPLAVNGISDEAEKRDPRVISHPTVWMLPRGGSGKQSRTFIRGKEETEA